jgi:alpha-amylase
VAAGRGETDDGDAIASIHDIVMTKQSGLSAHLRYDPDERRSGLVRFLAPDVSAADAAIEVHDLGDFAGEPWAVTGLSPDAVTVARNGLVRAPDGDHPVHAEKTIRIGGDRWAPTVAVDVTVMNRGSGSLTTRLAVEWSTVLLGGGGNPAAWQEAGGERVAHDARLTVAGIDAMAAGNDDLGVAIGTRIAPESDLWAAPIETVSNSEGGFELVYQGSAALIGRVVTLGPGERATISIEHRATISPGRGFGASTLA